MVGLTFAEWEPVYEAILDDFGYDRAGDERARDLLAELVGRTIEPAEASLSGRVAVAGAGPTLEDELGIVRAADAVVAASSAAARLDDRGVAVDWIVTDLDGRPARTTELAEAGTPVAVHAHGDNRPAIEGWVPRVEATVLPTTQAAPTDRVCNFGGFTDGDRAAFLADAFGADRLVFPGWTITDSGVSAEKERKLAWAERLLYWLERRRGERFDLLDGRRESLSVP
ncbi:hypothetical protein BRC62_01790 [Halobacteriales archaeon QH_10_67_13]|nr:MAG: hypothetical protein BRC62_01790 [Halobacteriales archaeon QH_10_67_13]